MKERLVSVYDEHQEEKFNFGRLKNIHTNVNKSAKFKNLANSSVYQKDNHRKYNSTMRMGRTKSKLSSFLPKIK